ncbi:MAG: phosphoribosylformylglycinamidine synthase subunit PurS [Candidatus Hydrothermarchaeota archaeon]
MHKVEVRVKLKPGVLDAEGETVKKSLRLLGFDVDYVRTIKVYEIGMNKERKEEVLKEIEDACNKLLANPVIQDYEITVKD